MRVLPPSQPHPRLTRRIRDARTRTPYFLSVLVLPDRALLLRQRHLHILCRFLQLAQLLVHQRNLVHDFRVHGPARWIRRRARPEGAADIVVRAGDQGALVCFDALHRPVDLVVAAADRLPHLRVVRPQAGRALVVEQGIEVHLEDLVRLSEAVPGAVVFAVDVDGAAVGLDGRVRVFHLDVLVAHERPGGEEVAVEGEGAPEVLDRFLVLGFERVVVADDAAGFGAEFVGCGGELGDEGEFGAGGHDIEDVGVVVEGVDAVRVGVEDVGEDGFRFVEV